MLYKNTPILLHTVCQRSVVYLYDLHDSHISLYASLSQILGGFLNDNVSHILTYKYKLILTYKVEQNKNRLYFNIL